MQTELEPIMLEAAKSYLRTLSNAEFLAVSCNLSKLHDGIIRVVHNQSLNRIFRAPNRVTADIFCCSKDNIKHFLRKSALKNEKG